MVSSLIPAVGIRFKNADWLNDNAVKKIYGFLDNGADTPQALFVGGCVRDAVLGKAVEDIDMATVLLPHEVMSRLEGKGVRVIPTGIDHGTVTAVLDGQSFEITTLRKDVATDGRRATVAFTQDWKEDAERRDFTMNTLLADLEGNIYDPLKSGAKDLKTGRVVFVGNAAQRIDEDHLRILRFFRFHALHGIGEPDKNALKACREKANKIYDLSKERITQEFFKILMAERAVDVLSLMFESKVLKVFFVSDDQMRFFKHFCEFQERYGLTSLASRLFVLADLDLKRLSEYLKLLLCPKVFLKDIEAISQIISMPDMDNDHGVKVAVYNYGRVAAAQALVIEMVQDRVMNGYVPKALDIIQNWVVPDFPVSGEDLKKAGLTPGPTLGKTLSRLEEEWIQSDFKIEKSKLLQNL